MKVLNDIRKAINDASRVLEDRLFMLIILCSWVALMIVFIMDLILGENTGEIVALGVTLFLTPPFSYLCIRYHKRHVGTWIILIGVVFVVMPISFVSGGGIAGGTPIWYSFCFLFAGTLLRGKERIFAMAFIALEVAVFYYLSLHRLVEIGPHTFAMTYWDSLVSVLVVGLVITMMSWFQGNVFKHEKDIAEEQKREIEELNRAQNRFFSSMSHEIRTPINTIIGLDEMILREDISDEVADDARNIKAAGKMLLTTINDILDMSKIESGSMEIIPVPYRTGDMLSEIVGMIWVKAKEKGLEFHVDVDQTLPVQLYGDEVRIKQVLINVLNNAIKYTQEGSITLSIQEKRGEGKKTTVIYSVSDTGMGIKKESIPYLFDAFKRVDEGKNRHIEGTGLGLAIVKQFIEMMGGKITVNSVYRKGSTFIIELPQEIADDTEVGDLKIESKHSMKDRSHYKQSFEAPEAHILIVDDNDMNIKVVTKLLRETKVNMDTASSGKEALELASRRHFDTIFMDHLMPNMDGIECLHEIRNQAGGLNRETPIVVLTANAGSENQEMYNREGFNGYLLKPVSGDDLETELSRHLPADLVHFTGEDDPDNVRELVRKGVRKRSIVISTDSICDLPENLVAENMIEILPYHVHTEEGDFLDGIETETEGILAYLNDPKKKVYSDAPEVEDYESFFAGLLSKGQYVIHITMSGKFSRGYGNALEASRNFDNVMVVDSMHVSGGVGLLVLYAAKRAKDSVTPENLVKELEGFREKIKTSFIVDTTSYLARSGRVSQKVNSLSNAFMLHPVLVLRNGNLVAGSMMVGTRKSSWEKYISQELKSGQERDGSILLIECVGMNVAEKELVVEKVRARAHFDEIIVMNASPAISINSGPYTFGLIYMMK
ncbi:MAG: DegV family EDD domain-containing protein [Lachnospiraceae bacterium]|nr:DegV family EDD domain-containing protein [Lachnospiraceae bacterium]